MMLRYILPSSSWFLNFFGFKRCRIFLRNCNTCSTNSGRSYYIYSFYNCCSFDSFTSGRTSVMQSRCLKKDVSKRLMRFLSSMSSEKPFCNANDLSKYSPGVIVSPLPLINCSEKSLTTQQNEGKYSLSSSGSTSSYSECALI
jgi:hypothetical protein